MRRKLKSSAPDLPKNIRRNVKTTVPEFDVAEEKSTDDEDDIDLMPDGILKKVRGFVKTSLRYVGYIKYILLLLFIPPFLNYASLQREAEQLLPDAGQLYDIGYGQKMYMSCKGTGAPTVILDAPTGMTSDVWILIQEQVSKVTKVCVYDRAGLGFSERPFRNFSQSVVVEEEANDDDDDDDDDMRRDDKVKAADKESDIRGRWAIFTVERMADDLHQLLTISSQQSQPFVLVGSELGSLVARFYAQIYESEVSDVVLVDPLVEDLFQQDSGVWTQFWFGHLVPTYQGFQFAAATGISRLALILGLISQPIKAADIPDEVVARQKHLMCNPRHLSSVVDEHHFINDTFSQIRTVWRLKPFNSQITVTVLTGNYYDEQLPSTLNKAWAKAQQGLISKLLPQSKHFVINGGDHRMIYRDPSPISESIIRVAKQRRHNLKSSSKAS